MTLVRLPEWRPRLHEWLQEVDGRVIAPGQHDCCLFAAGAVQAQTGVDIAAGWRGCYSTLAGGRRLLQQRGYADHVDLIADLLPEGPRLAACEGDIAVLQTDEGPAAGVVQGPAIFVLHPSGRLGLAPLSACVRLFRVG